MKKRDVAIVLAVSAAFAASIMAIPQSPLSVTSNNFQSVPNTVIPTAVAESNNRLSLDLYREFIKDENRAGKNVFFSPSSIYVAFSMLYEGARADTAADMEYVFGFDPDAITRHNDILHTTQSINREDPHATLKMANALWPATWFKVYDMYVDTMRTVYTADVEVLDYLNKKEESIKRLNNWADVETNGLIEQILEPGDPSINALTALVLTNAIYFKGMWVVQFPPEDTSDSEFCKSETDSVDADFMHVTGMFNFTQNDVAQVLKMPYKGDRLSMLVALPAERGGIADLESTVTVDMLDDWNKSLKSQEVVVSMPKFTMGTEYDLTTPISSLGAGSMFSTHYADLTGLAYPVDSIPDDYPNLFVSKAIHHAYVDVNEEGTEAAAVTVIVVETEGAPIPLLFTADRPFLFFIQDDESGMILFIGRVSDPAS